MANGYFDSFGPSGSGIFPSMGGYRPPGAAGFIGAALQDIAAASRGEQGKAVATLRYNEQLARQNELERDRLRRKETREEETLRIQRDAEAREQAALRIAGGDDLAALPYMPGPVGPGQPVAGPEQQGSYAAALAEMEATGMVPGKYGEPGAGEAWLQGLDALESTLPKDPAYYQNFSDPGTKLPGVAPAGPQAPPAGPQVPPIAAPVMGQPPAPRQAPRQAPAASPDAGMGSYIQSRLQQNQVEQQRAAAAAKISPKVGAPILEKLRKEEFDLRKQQQGIYEFNQQQNKADSGSWSTGWATHPKTGQNVMTRSNSKSGAVEYMTPEGWAPTQGQGLQKAATVQRTGPIETAPEAKLLTRMEKLDALDDTINLAKETLSPTDFTLVGAGRAFIQDIEELSGTMQTFLSNTAEEARVNEPPEGKDFKFDEYFDKGLATKDYLLNSLAYQMAKARDEDGRISDADYKTARTEVGGKMSSYQDFRAVTDLIQEQSDRKRKRLGARLGRIRGRKKGSVKANPRTMPGAKKNAEGKWFAPNPNSTGSHDLYIIED